MVAKGDNFLYFMLHSDSTKLEKEKSSNSLDYVLQLFVYRGTSGQRSIIKKMVVSRGESEIAGSELAGVDQYNLPATYYWHTVTSSIALSSLLGILLTPTKNQQTR